MGLPVFSLKTGKRPSYRVAEAVEGPPGRKHNFMVMERWGGRASKPGGFQRMKIEWKKKRKHGIGREKEGETERKREKHEKEGEDFSFPLPIPAQLEEGPPGHLSSWAKRRSLSLPSP